jgi:hypothetical protein
MSRLREVTIPPARVWGENRPSFYVVEARGTAGAIAANRLLGVASSVSWLTEPFAAGGYTYAPGSLVANASDRVRDVVNELARSFGLRADGMRGRQPATSAIRNARTALYKPWRSGIDEGWTRWLLEQYEFPFTSLVDADIRAGGLAGRFDTIVLASIPGRIAREGLEEGTVPPEYAGGLGEAGIDALKAFVSGGGTLVCLDESCGLAIGALGVPVTNVVADAPPDTFLGPGSIVRVELDATHPLAFGMTQQTAGFFAYSSAYEPAAGATGAAASVAARYGSEDLLLSGFLEGADAIAGRAAVVDARVGDGRVILLGFRVQHRGQSLATFRLLFNAILTSN